MFSRIPAIRRLPKLAVVPVRYTSSLKEGSVAQSQGFSKKEKAHEDQYIVRQTAKKLQALHAEIEAKTKELDALTKEHEQLAKEREDKSE